MTPEQLEERDKVLKPAMAGVYDPRRTAINMVQPRIEAMLNAVAAGELAIVGAGTVYSQWRAPALCKVTAAEVLEALWDSRPAKADYYYIIQNAAFAKDQNYHVVHVLFYEDLGR